MPLRGYTTRPPAGGCDEEIGISSVKRHPVRRLTPSSEPPWSGMSFLEALPDPVLATSAEGEVTCANEAARALLGRSRQLEGSTIAELLPLVASPPAPGASEHEPEIWQGSLAGAGGPERSVEVARRPIATEGGETAYLYRVHDLSAYLQLARDREVLLHGAAHELRNPVTALENTLDLLSTEGATMSAQEFKRLLDLASRTAARLAQLTEGLLNAATIRSGNLHVFVEPCRLSTLLDFALDGVAPLIEGRVQTVQRDVPEGLWVLADPRFAPRVLANLLANASKYSPRGAAIRVGAAPRGDEAHVAVQDRGPGIPKAQLEGLFERYYRARPADEEPGLGLGLAIAKAIVEAHGGAIGVSSEPGVGTTFWFTLRSARGPA